MEPGRAGTGEGELVQRFFDGIGSTTPDLVSWNGSGFDLPVLTTGPPAGVRAARYWETGDTDTASATTITSAAITGGTPI